MRIGSRQTRLRIAAAAVMALLAAPSAMAAPYIDLGIADELALDQPRVAVELLTEPEFGEPQAIGPEFANTFLLDTGSNAILAVGFAVSELNSGGMVNVAVYEELGVAGTTPMNVSDKYQFDFAGTNGERFSLPGTRIMSNGNLNFGGFFGIAGMPAMMGRSVTMDMTPWSDLSDFYMHTVFGDTVPASNGHRYEVPITMVGFPQSGQQDPNDPLPTWAPLPFVTARARFGNKAATGNFLIDTGAQLSIISSDIAFEIGLDEDGDGNFDNEKIDDIEVGGIGGTVSVPRLRLGGIGLDTTAGAELRWTDPSAIVIDIDDSIDGIIGMDLLTSGWFAKVFLGLGDDGYLEQVHFDFRDADTGTAAMIFDLNPLLDVYHFQGDLNGDGEVDGLDANILSLAWLTNDPEADANGDGIVNALDANIVSLDWTAGTGAALIPEPAGAVLWLLAAMGLWTRRRMR